MRRSVAAVLKAAGVADEGQEMNWGVVRAPGDVDTKIRAGDWAVNEIDNEPYIVFVRAER